jgi:hypothetical protein
MALKRKIDKATFDKLKEEIKSEYEEKDGSYVLVIDGEDDPVELKRAKDREAQRARDEKKRADELQAKLDDATGNDAKKRGDIETLEKSWKEKYEKREKELTDKLGGKDEFIKKTLVDSVAASLATKLAGDKAAIMLPHIKARLTADLDGEMPTTKILDATGKVSALTTDELEKEFVANKDFSAIVIGSKASGGGTSNDNKQRANSGAILNANGQPKSFREMSVNEKRDYLDSKKTET